MSDKVKRKYVKHDHEERVMAIKKVLEEGWSIRAAARLINANHRQVSFWLSTYEKYGNLRPVRKHGSYSAGFKRKVVSDIVRNSLTLQQAALKYGLPCASAVRTWKERYHKYGDAAYIVKP
ncbi:helix-turn-helix domain-containing protein, partial [Bacteroides fragilis]